MIGYHVTTPKKLERYQQTGGILAPVRFWPNEYLAKEWMKRTGRNIILKINCNEAYPLPMRKPAYWTREFIREWEINYICHLKENKL